MEAAVLGFKKVIKKIRLNKRAVDALPVPAEVNGRPVQSWTYDLATPRLAVCAWSSGAKVWYWIGRVNGRPARVKLGGFPEIQPEQARKLAAKFSAKVSEGIDPRQQKQARRDEQTFGELWTHFYETHVKPKRAATTAKEYERQYTAYLVSWQNRKLSEINVDAVQRLHARLGKHNGRYLANRVLALLSAMFTWAKVANPTTGIERFQEHSRERFMGGDELPRFFTALAEEEQYWQDFFTLLLLTGVRRRNLQAARFEQFKLAAATWTIPKTKNGQPHNVALPAEAVAIVQRRLAEANGNPHLFPACRGASKEFLDDPRKGWARICKRAGLVNLRMHDLRRTLGSWQAATGASLPIIGRSLGHRTASATQVYARLDLDPVRHAVDTAVAAMMAASKQEGDKQ